jgi:1-acyl-sn-glycerol-3-phosphate acyltransferase
MNATIHQFISKAEMPAAATFPRLAVLAAKDNSFAHTLLNELRRLQPDWQCIFDDNAAPFSRPGKIAATSCIYVPSLTTFDGIAPDMEEVRRMSASAAIHQSGHLVLLSSALIYGTGPGRQGLATEDSQPPRNGSPVSSAWSALEAAARENLRPGATLTILRPAIVAGWPTFFTRMLSHRITPSLSGHDPVLQFLGLSDLVTALVRVIQAGRTGVFNVAPDGVVPLHQAIRLIGGMRLPIPRTLRRIVQSQESLEFLRYSWTISGAKIGNELGIVPGESSVAALREFRAHRRISTGPAPKFDEFGMDEDYIRFYGKSLFKFLSEYYWRIEDKGLEHIPRHGRAILVGMHRGFMPWDGVMALHTIVKKTGRYPRFLTHPGLLKFPFMANFMTKLGGVVACQESGENVLERDGILGIFPEGIHGAFTYYRDAHKLQAFGRDAFVKLAIRYRAPIVPFVTLGSAEIFPILAKIKSRRWTRYMEWPCIPITPTFPLLPVPLPSKWHSWFLPPVHVDQYPPEAADDRTVVKAISREVRTRMQQAVDEMVARRRSVFHGSIFDGRTDEGQTKPVAI